MKLTETINSPATTARQVIIDAANWRYATKKFDPAKPLEKDDIDALLNTLRMSPTAFGLQPFHFFVIKNQPLRQELFKYANNQRQVLDSSLFIVFAAKTRFEDDELKAFVNLNAELRNYDTGHKNSKLAKLHAFTAKLSGDELFHWSAKQSYLAMGELISAAALMKIDACPMEGIDQKEYDRILGLELLNLGTVAAVALGYRSDTDSYQRQPKVRKNHDDLISTI
ncbi:MAG: NAD(P)H-dependent oxidoreductase [Cryomorphaceae bacterium]